MTDQHTTAADTDQRANVLPYCDACEDDHPSRVAADGAVICAREGEADETARRRPWRRRDERTA